MSQRWRQQRASGGKAQAAVYSDRCETRMHARQPAPGRKGSARSDVLVIRSPVGTGPAGSARPGLFASLEWVDGSATGTSPRYRPCAASGTQGGLASPDRTHRVRGRWPRKRRNPRRTRRSGGNQPAIVFGSAGRVVVRPLRTHLMQCHRPSARSSRSEPIQHASPASGPASLSVPGACERDLSHANVPM